MTPETFRQNRLNLGMNTTQLANALGCVERHVRRLEAGIRGITPEISLRMEELANGDTNGKQ